MAVEVVGYRKRKRKDEAKRAARAKKEKILLAVCGVVLLGVLAFEGPKTLKRFHGSSAAPATVAPTASTTTPATGPQAANSTAKADSLGATKHLASKDPFVAQLGTEAAGSSQFTTVAGPAVRESHFVKKDPFIQQLSFAAPPTASSTTAPTTAPTEKPASGTPASKKPAGDKAEPGGNYIVMVASIPISDGHGAARAEAAKARSQGIASVKIVDSSSYPTLRTGFYAVYSGPYPTLAELLPALEQVRGKGYPSAYTRRLAH